MKRIKKIMVAACSVLAVMVLFFALQRLVAPKYAGDEEAPLEGNFTAEYYKETTDHDVIMVGDCEVYENFDPIYLWKNYGITSYIRGNAQQLTWQSYYMLEDTLKREKPKVVIYNIQALSHGEPQRETYNRMTLDGMKWSKTKVDAIQASMCEGENMLDYIFPILRYHSRITDLNKNDLKYYFEARRTTHNGYYMRIDTLPASESDVADTTWLLGTEQEKADAENGGDEIDDPWAEIDDSTDVEESDEDEIDDPWADVDNADSGEDGSIEEPGADTSADDGKDKTFGAYPMKYLEKMRKLCEKEGIQLILIKAPSLAPQWYDSQNEQVVEYAKKHNLPYINFYELLEETGIDYETDTYDGGLHMNYSGAQKLSKYLGKVLSQDYGLKDHRNEKDLARVYKEKIAFQEDMIEKQQKELEEFGEIVSY